MTAKTQQPTNQMPRAVKLGEPQRSPVTCNNTHITTIYRKGYFNKEVLNPKGSTKQGKNIGKLKHYQSTSKSNSLETLDKRKHLNSGLVAYTLNQCSES